MSYHDKTANEVMLELRAPASGLASAEAQTRLRLYGRNVIAEKGRTNPFILFLAQFKSPIVWVLIVAMVVSFAVREATDAVVIGVILVLNALLGFVQEYRAEGAIAALRKLTALKAKVLRDGREQLIDATELVPGDVILLETGDKVPADARLIEAINLQCQEAALTGESTPVAKDAKPVAFTAQVADRTNLVHSSTIVTAGRCKAVVVGTGSRTEIGRIAKLIEEARPEPTPLQKKLAGLSIWLTIVVVIVAVIVFLTGWFEGHPLFDFFLAAVALAVAAIPEGLPAIVTMALALGVQRMARRNALIRKLPSAETLGSCTVICSDKTGTLTHNEMTVRKVWVDGKVVEVSGSGYSPEGMFSAKPKDLPLLLITGALCNDSRVTKNGNAYQVFGDPTEAALVVSAEKLGLNPETLAKEQPRVAEIEFTSERKRMTTVHRQGRKLVAYLKGAPDVVLDQCTHLLLNGKTVPLTPARRQEILRVNAGFGNEALRVLGFALRFIAKEQGAAIERGMLFLGLQAMIDPPRAEVRDAIKECETAGIKVIMITGDHPNTAQAIAKELGIPGSLMTGAELEKHPDLASVVEQVGVYARVNPEHKIRIVEALQKQGHVVAMTGDGVNDAPALKKADIGIAMGITGTDVAKEASAMVLADDNFASIVEAVREGRRIFDNILKFIMYLLSANTGEVLTIFVALLLGLPLPILAIQLLWINLVTDGLPALALGVEPAEAHLMQRKPRKASERIITLGRGLDMAVIGLTIMGAALFLFSRYDDVAMARTAAFSALVLSQMFNVLNKRSHDSVFTTNPFSNTWALLAIGSSIALQLVVIYSPLNLVFGTVPLGAMDWLWIVGVSASALVAGELLKLIRGHNG